MDLRAVDEAFINAVGKRGAGQQDGQRKSCSVASGRAHGSDPWNDEVGAFPGAANPVVPATMPTEKIIVIQSLEQSTQQYDAPSAEQSAQLLLPAPQRFRQDKKTRPGPR
ncbi:hypothetical protein D3C71_1924830 [compost metagenome]